MVLDHSNLQAEYHITRVTLHTETLNFMACYVKTRNRETSIVLLLRPWLLYTNLNLRKITKSHDKTTFFALCNRAIYVIVSFSKVSRTRKRYGGLLN